MTKILFAFDNPQPGGSDLPAAGTIRCALFQTEVDSGRLRSTREFTLTLDANGEAWADLSPAADDQAWYIVIEGVAGAGERWVFVPESAEPVHFTNLVLVDPTSIPILPAQRSQWEDISGLAAVAMRRASDAYVIAEKANVFRADLYYPGELSPRVGLAAFVWPYPVRIKRVIGTISGGGSGQAVIADVNVNGTTIFSPQSNRPSMSSIITTSQRETSAYVPALARVTVDIDQVGTTLPGNDLVVSLFLEPV